MAISVLLVSCYYYLEEPEEVIELEDQIPIELKCGNFDSLAQYDYQLERAGQGTCQSLLICDGFSFIISQNYLNEQVDLIEFTSPAYTIVFCYSYASNGTDFELAGIDYVSPDKTSMLIPHWEDSDIYTVRVDCVIGAFQYDKYSTLPESNNQNRELR